LSQGYVRIRVFTTPTGYNILYSSSIQYECNNNCTCSCIILLFKEVFWCIQLVCMSGTYYVHGCDCGSNTTPTVFPVSTFFGKYSLLSYSVLVLIYCLVCFDIRSSVNYCGKPIVDFFSYLYRWLNVIYYNKVNVNFTLSIWDYKRITWIISILYFQRNFDLYLLRIICM